MLLISSEGDVNKCSVVFRGDNGRVENNPSTGLDGKLCNILESNSNVITSRRDQGIWYNDVYRVSSEDKWLLLYTDSCTDCQKMKIIYYKMALKRKRNYYLGTLIINIERH